ncbi:cytochrome c family protein [Massilia sp. YMA4]|uniref:c-type cytochrome n=1 Tax=Massilia sp. YMA4 TaxID=1593482 RepID=UPI001D0C966A|nr:cytochrome c family protein [Massilia sp. YMA4]
MIRLSLSALLALAAMPLVLSAHAAPPPGDPVAGAAAFRKCASCHQVGPAARGGFGPQLNGIIGRRAAASTDYAYSAALRRSGIVWTDAALARFLRDPDAMVPGTKMRFWGIGDERQIANLLAYLRQYP